MFKPRISVVLWEVRGLNACVPWLLLSNHAAASIPRFINILCLIVVEIRNSVQWA